MKQDRVETVVNDLGYDFERFDLTDFVHHIERLKRREILVVPFPFQPELSAMWIRTSVRNYIVYNQNLHPIHQMHSILHELAHMMLNHRGHPLADVLPSEMLAQLEGDEPVGRLRTVTSLLKNDTDEQEAEAFVYAIQKRLVAAQRIAALMGQTSSIAALRDQVDGMGYDT